MSYIDKSLGDGETVIARAHFHWLYVTAAWLWLLIPLALLGYAYSQAAQTQPDPLTVGAGVLVAIGLIFFLRLMTRKWSTEIGVTSHRFVERYGLLSMRTNEIALPNIEGVRVNQSILGRIFGYGTVKIEGTGVDSVTTPTIAYPVSFVRAIQTAREHTAARFEAGRNA
jgi:Bacterial PH domain